MIYLDLLPFNLDSLEKQAEDKGYVLRDADTFEELRSSLNTLSSSGMVCDVELKNITVRIQKAINKNMEEI